jgi:hypothetical protein
MQSHSLEFWPHHCQFVLYDMKTPYDPEMVPHFNGPDDIGGPISIRRLEVSIALLQDADVRIELSLHDSEPISPEGSWTLNLQATLEVPSGVLGVGDIIHDFNDPELRLEVRPGKLNLRAHGRVDDSGQVFVVQLWPV